MFGRGGLDPKKIQKLMKQMGVKTEEMTDVQRVTIELSDKKLVIPNPQVQITEMKGQKTYQIIGEAEEQKTESDTDITDEDIEMVMEQTNVDRETAKEALEKTDGDIAQAIVNLTE